MEYIRLTDKQFRTMLELCIYTGENDFSALEFKKGKWDFTLNLHINDGEFTPECFVGDYQVLFTDEQTNIIVRRLEQEYDDLHPESEQEIEQRKLDYLENSSYDTYSDERKGLNG